MQAQESLPQDLAAAHAMIVAERAARLSAEAEVAAAKADRRVLDIEIERLKLEIARLRRERFGASAERSARIAQLELALEDLEETAAAVEATEEPMTAEVRTVGRRKPARRPLPDHLPRVRVVEPAPTACPCCGGELRKLGEDVTETLERVPARWTVVQHVREKFSCRCCETITQAPAPFHPIARGRAGANLLAEVVFGKYGLHLPLHRQSAGFAREGVELDVSTLADWVGAVSVALRPLVEAIAVHARAGPRIHADDTPVPVLAKGKTKTGRLWTVVRDDRPFGGTAPPAAAYFYSPDRSGEHAQAFLRNFSGLMQADAFSGFGRLYVPGREGGPVIEAACWAHYLESGFMWSGGPPPWSWPMTAGRRTPHNSPRSERLQEREQVRLGLPGLGLGRLDPRMLPEGLQRIALHLQICRDVSAGGGHAGMAEIVADDGHVGAGLEQRHRATVAQYMGRDPLVGERRTLLCCDRRDIFAQDVGDPVAGQRLTVPIHEDMLLVGARRHAAKVVQCIGRLAP